MSRDQENWNQEIGSPEVIDVWKVAVTARARAYAPYSKFLVGSALKIKEATDSIAGCNVENASFGATVCAERISFFSARAQYGKFEPEFMVLVTEPAATPCALCLQVMNEFCGPDFAVYIADTKKIVEKRLLKELLPFSFGPQDLDI